MTFLAPAALALLLAVPLLWWLHRKRDEPTVQRVASLLLYRRAALEGASAVPRRRFDVTLWCVLAAATLLAVAAAGPVVGMEPPGAYVVVDRSVSMARHAAAVEARLPALLDSAAGAVTLSSHDLGGPSEPADGLPGSLAPHLSNARSLGYPGIVLVTDRVLEPGAGIVAIGPGVLPVRNVGILGAFLDADRGPLVRVRNHGAEPVALRVVDRDAQGADVTLGGREEAVYAMPSPQGDLDFRLVAEDGSAWADELPEDDRFSARIEGRVDGVRLACAGPAPRTQFALSAVCDHIVIGDDDGVDAVVVIGGDAPVGVPAVVFARGGGAERLDAARLVAHGEALGAFLPSPARRLVATGSPGPGDVVWSGPNGPLVTLGEGRVTIALDPEHADSTWHLDPSFPVLLAAALDHVVGGPERIVPSGPVVPASEGALPTELVPEPNAEALKRIVRDPRAAADSSLATWLALIAALLIAAAVVSGRRR